MAVGGKSQRWWRKQQDRAQRFPFLCGWLRPGVCIRKPSYPRASCPAPGPGPALGSEPRQHHGHTGLCWIMRAVPSLGQRAQGLCCRAQPIPQRLWGAHGCCGAHGAISTAPMPRFLAHSRAGCQLCRDFAFSSTAGCVSVFVFLRRCPSAAFQGPSRGTTSPEGPAALPDASQAQPWDSFGAMRPTGTMTSRA